MLVYLTPSVQRANVTMLAAPYSRPKVWGHREGRQSIIPGQVGCPE